jgi:hypothetical protein
MKQLITIADVKAIYNRPDISDAQIAEFVRRLNVAANQALGETNDLKAFCDHLETYKGLEDLRFDFMLIDFLNLKDNEENDNP